MFLRLFLKIRRSWRRCLQLALSVLLTILILDGIIITKFIPGEPKLLSSSTGSSLHHSRVFIASIHWNNEAILRSHWTTAVLDLVRNLGPDNVYVSIIEGGSWDDTKGALRDLDLELEKIGVESSIILDDITHKNEVERVPGQFEEGWVWTSREKMELRRIPYLAGLRNRVMDKIGYLANRTDGQRKRTFDKVLWLNDVIFTVRYSSILRCMSLTFNAKDRRYY